LHGIDDAVHVIEATYQRLQHRYEFDEWGALELKGKGAMRTYLLAGKKIA